jgi:uncharacterized protein (TIGR03437 family)
MMRSNLAAKLVLLALAVLPARSFAQTFDLSGDKLLNGAYYLRQVFYFANSATGAVGRKINIQGTMTFLGNGGYKFSGTILDAAAASFPTPQPLSVSGAYAMSASGFGYMDAIDPEFKGDDICGLVSQGILIGSSSAFNHFKYNDLLIAAPIGSGVTDATLKGGYTAAYFDPTTTPAKDALLTMTADGQGNIGTVNVTGYFGANATSNPQTLTGVSYAFTSGAAQINFGGTPGASTLIAGQENLYISPNGEFIFGGSASGFDIFIGVRGATTRPVNYNGLYYQAGLDLNYAFPGLASYYGAIDIVPANSSFIDFPENDTFVGLVHERFYDSDSYSDFTYPDSYVLNGNGSSDNAGLSQHFVSSSDGTIRIGYDIGPSLGINVALRAPSLTGSGVYLNPTGVVNAASSAPFTAWLSPGEMITLYGTGLAPGPASASSLPLPDKLNGVQVLIDKRPAPILYVTATQISVLVPYLTEAGIAEIQVINGAASSNTVTPFVGTTSAGVFTNPANGLGYAAALHADFSLVSESSPAQVGETVALYLTGLGAVNPNPGDGAAAPTSPPSETISTPDVWLADTAGGFIQAPVTFSGLAPQLAGMYQINFTIPTGLAPGDADLEIIGAGSDTVEAVLPIGKTTGITRAIGKKTACSRARLGRFGCVTEPRP